MILFVVSVTGLSYLSRAEFVRVEKVEVQGNKIIKTETIEKIVESQRQTPYLWFFSRDNFAFFSRADTERDIYRQFATVGTVDVSFIGFKTISVHLTEHEPKYLWCDTAARINCYFMSPTGFIFMESADFSKEILFTFYGMINGDSPIGKIYMPFSKFIALNDFIKSLKLLGLSPVGLNARTEEDFQLYLATGGSILFSDKDDLLMTFENLETVIAEQTLKQKDFLSKLDYVDVRFSSKVFIKTK